MTEDTHNMRISNDQATVKLRIGEQAVDITELGNILKDAGANIQACFGTADRAAQWRVRAESAERRLAQVTELYGHHGMRIHDRERGELIGMNHAHFRKIMGYDGD